MKKEWLFIPAALIGASTLSVIFVGITSKSLGTGQWFLWLSALLSIASFVWLRREVGENDEEKVAAEKALTEEKRVFEALQQEWAEETQRRESLLLKRQQEFAQRLQTFHEWMEFPQPIDTAEGNEFKWLGKDKEVQKLLEEKTQIFFDKILNKKYYEGDNFESRLLLDDLIRLLESVARIYNPDSERPLLETSIEQLLRSVQRISMQLLVLLDRLPLNIKTYNLKETFDYVQKGVRAYGYYQATTPYLPYLKPVYYLGRMALGANPITLGAGYALTEIAKIGSKKLVGNLSKQYAINLLHDVVAIVGNESAGIFGGDYRHRDANWIYAAELTELIHQFPTSRDTLVRGLNECSNLLLRSEYDRVFLYQCITKDQSAGPALFQPQTWLNQEDRNAIAERLEKFFHHYIHGRQEKVVATWKTGVEERLGVKLQLDAKHKTQSQETQRFEAVSSLASFLLDIKGRSFNDLSNLLRNCQILSPLNDEEVSELLTKLEGDPPMIFGFPNLEPTDEVLKVYIDDLKSLIVEVHPFDVRGDLLLKDVADYYRYEQKPLQEGLSQGYVATLDGMLLPDSPERKVKPIIARCILNIVGLGERPRFLYDDVFLGIGTHEEEGSENPPLFEIIKQIEQRSLWLVGSDRRLMLISIDTKRNDLERDVRLLWEGLPDGNNKVEAANINGILTDDCALGGGTWHIEELIQNDWKPVVKIAGKKMTRFNTRFHHLLNFCNPSVGNDQ